MAKFLGQFQQCNSFKPTFKFNRQVQSFTFFIGGSGGEKHTRSNEDRSKLQFSYRDLARAYGKAGIRNPDPEPETETEKEPEPEPEPEPELEPKK